MVVVVVVVVVVLGRIEEVVCKGLMMLICRYLGRDSDSISRQSPPSLFPA